MVYKKMALASLVMFGAIAGIVYFNFFQVSPHNEATKTVSTNCDAPQEITTLDTSACVAQTVPATQNDLLAPKTSPVTYSPVNISCAQECPEQHLLVQGTIPSWLRGSLLRTGPALFEHENVRAKNVFDGCALMHKFSFDNSTVHYQSHFLRTSYWHQVTNEKIFGMKKEKAGGFFSKLGSLFNSKPTTYDNGNTNICRINGKFCAITETPRYRMFDPETLLAQDELVFDDSLSAHYICPHAHVDASTGDMYNYMIEFGNTSTYIIYKIPAGTQKRVVLAKISASYPSYMHSFGITENYLVLIEPPFRVNPIDLVLSDTSFFDTFVWKPKQKTTITLISKTKGNVVGTYTVDPFFFLHTINAYEKNNTVVVDLIAYKDAAIFKEFELDAWKNHSINLPQTCIQRITVLPTEKRALLSTQSSANIELPAINYHQHNGKPYSFVYATHTPADALRASELIKITIETGDSLRWQAEHCYPNEPLFIAQPGAQHEDEGVLLATVFDSKENKNFIVVLDAHTMTETARAYLPTHIPFDSHGYFYQK